MNTACRRRGSLITAGELPAIPSPTLSAPTGERPAARADRLRLSLAGSPSDTDRIEFTVTAHMGDLCYGLAVLVPLLSTLDCSDAVTVRCRTALRRTGAELHRPILPPSQAHERRQPARRGGSSSRLAAEPEAGAPAVTARLARLSSPGAGRSRDD